MKTRDVKRTILWFVLIITGAAGVTAMHLFMRQVRGSLFVLAALGAGLALLLALGTPPSPSRPPPTDMPGGRKRLAGGTLLALALLGSALLAFRGLLPAWLGPAGWLAALALMMWTVWPACGSARSSWPKIGRAELLLLAIICVIALIFRTRWITSLPYGIWFDEAQNIIESVRILHKPGHWPVFVPDLSQLPALTFYFYTPFIWLFGPTIDATRAATTIIGIAAILATWAFARQAFNPPVAVIAALCLALSRWHVTFSRFAMAHVWTTLFVPLVLFFALRAVHGQSLRHAVLGGIALGIGLQSYYAMFMALPLLVLYFIHARAAGTVPREGYRLVLAAFVIAAAVSYAPVGDYALRNWEHFSERFRAVSGAPSDASFAARLNALEAPLLSHLKMFHFHGDGNGRHNLPGAPMLDPVTGIAFMVGLVWSAALFWKPPFSLLLTWCTVMLAAGVFSLAFEAPQGARTVGILPAVSVLAALPLGQLWLAAGAKPLGRLTAAAVLCALFAVAADHNWRTYFDRQLFDPAVWSAFSAPETKVAELLLAEGHDVDVFVPEPWIGGPTQNLLVPGHISRLRPFIAARDLPLSGTRPRAIVLLTGGDDNTRQMLRRLYPQTVFEAVGPRRPGARTATPVLEAARISAHDLQRSRAWVIGYQTADGVVERPAPASTIFDWSEAPVPPPFTAVVHGCLRIADNGGYRFKTTGGLSLAIDGLAIPSAGEEPPAEIMLARGSHRIEVTAKVLDQAPPAQLLWQPPRGTELQPIPAHAIFGPSTAPGGLLGEYYHGNFSGEPAFQQIDSQIAFYFHYLPLPIPFSVRWRGQLIVPRAGRYIFRLSAIDEAALTLNGETVLQAAPGSRESQATVALEKGLVPIEVRYHFYSGYAQIYLSWDSPGRAGLTLIPPEALKPAPPIIVERTAP